MLLFLVTARVFDETKEVVARISRLPLIWMLERCARAGKVIEIARSEKRWSCYV